MNKSSLTIIRFARIYCNIVFDLQVKSFRIYDLSRILNLKSTLSHALAAK